MGFHQMPVARDHGGEHWHLHATLPAAAAIRRGAKVHGRFEMLGTPQRDITPESAAERLRPKRSALQVALSVAALKQTINYLLGGS